MNGRRLIDALRRDEPEPPPVPGGGRGMYLDPRQVPVTLMQPAMEAGQPPPAAPQMPAGTLGYAVARCDPYGHAVLTHTSLMPADEAGREADAQRRADGRGYAWLLVEVRRA